MNQYVNFSEIPDNITNVKLDIGLSYNAPQSQSWLEHDSNTLVYGFEPNPDSIKSILSGNIVKRHSCHGTPLNSMYIREKRFHLIPVALSNVEQEDNMSFFVTQKDHGCSSLYYPKSELLGPIEKETTVSVFSLKHFFDIFPWDRFNYIDYIKVDAQGSDLDILKGAKHYLRDRVVYVTAEADGNQYNGAYNCNIKDILTYMIGEGFEYVDHPNTQDLTFLNKKYLDKKNIWIQQL